MTFAEMALIRDFTPRIGGSWAPMRVWEHRRHAMIARHDCMRGQPDETAVEACPAWGRSEAQRIGRLKRHLAQLVGPEPFELSVHVSDGPSWDEAR